jgi:hypothetical protein
VRREVKPDPPTRPADHLVDGVVAHRVPDPTAPQIHEHVVAVQIPVLQVHVVRVQPDQLAGDRHPTAATLAARAVGVVLARDDLDPPLVTDDRFERQFDRAHHTMRETQCLDEEGSPRTYELRVYGADELCRMLEDAGFAVVERHASLEGTGEPGPSTPLVLVAEPSASRE